MTISESIKNELYEEKKRIRSPFHCKENNGIIIKYIVHCNKRKNNDIANMAKKILLSIQKYSFLEWPKDAEWRSILPKEFIDSFLDHTKEDDWTLDDWLYWLKPENRFWFLWSINEKNSNYLEIKIIVYEHPYPWESLEVLFMKLGTSELREINDITN